MRADPGTRAFLMETTRWPGLRIESEKKLPQ